MSHKGCGVSTGNDRRYLNIYVTVTQGAFFRPGQPAIIRKTENSLHMCYPTHCSKSQLDYFIRYFSPARFVKFPEFLVGVMRTERNILNAFLIIAELCHLSLNIYQNM